MKLRRIMIAAPKSGSGKTTITCALLQVLGEMGQPVAAYKCGPDYIDPMFHRQVIGVPSKNLDTFFTDEQMTRELFLAGRKEGELAVLEGVMGIFDGLGGIREEGSSYHLARVTKTPIILVVDAKGMGRSVAALIAGFLAYDKERLIRGVILNRMSREYYEIVKPLIEAELGIAVLGYYPEDKDLVLESRHLGLKMPGELAEIHEQLKEAAKRLKETVLVERLLEIAGAAGELPKVADVDETLEGMLDADEQPAMSDETTGEVRLDACADGKKPVIAVARDEAFCFYYEDNLRLLREYGAELRYFSPLHDVGLPKGCSGILLGGGYPELYAQQLSENTIMHEEVRQAFAKGMPVVAECGGFMYLHSRLCDREGRSYPMAGVLPGTCHDTGKLVRFGYIEITERREAGVTQSFLPAGEMIRGHEFHYFDSSDNGEGCLAVKPTTGRSYPCIWTGENCWLGFPHLYYPSNPAFARHFVERAAAYAGKQVCAECRNMSAGETSDCTDRSV